jgi:hypothetical protein
MKMIGQRLASEQGKASEGASAQESRVKFGATGDAISAQLAAAVKARDHAKENLGGLKAPGRSMFGLLSPNSQEMIKFNQAKSATTADLADKQKEVDRLEREMQDAKLKSGNRFITREAEIEKAEKEGRMTAKRCDRGPRQE